MIRKKEIQKEAETQHKEIENTSQQLEDFTREEKYKEAEAIDMRLKKLKELVLLLIPAHYCFIGTTERRRNEPNSRRNQHDRAQTIEYT